MKKKKGSRCRALVSSKIRKIHEEGIRGRSVEPNQAVAAGINMTKKAHPECAAPLRKKRSRSK